MRESAYEKAFAEDMRESKIQYNGQLYMPINYLGKKIASRFFDFLIEDKIVVELKAGGRFLSKDIEQIYEYLRLSNLRLGIIINFGKEEVRFKRIVNLDENS